MLNRNLIAIAIVTLGLVMTINTFGQGRTPVSKKDKPKRSDAQIKLMYVANQEEYMAGGIADVHGGPKDKNEETARTKPNSGSIKAPQPKAMNKADLTEQLSINSPRDVASGQATGKRQHKPVQTQDKLGNFEIQDLLMTPKQVQAGQNSGGTISNQRTKRNSQDKLGNFEIQDIKSPRNTASGQATGKRQPTQDKLGNFEIQIAKRPTANLGDTGTHEVGHKQRKARKN